VYNRLTPAFAKPHNTVRDIMSNQLYVATPSTSVMAALDSMRHNRISMLPIVQDDKEQLRSLVGILTEQDIKGIVKSNNLGYVDPKIEEVLKSLPIASVMNTSVTTLEEDASFEEAARVLGEHNLPGVPVVDKDNNFVGVITSKDIITSLLNQTEKVNYSQLLQSIGNAQIVMIGEASHGTQEFYRERARITQSLIEEKGFTGVAVEGDWPDTYRINRYLHGISKQDKTAEQSLRGYKRFPLWMWRNTEVLNFLKFADKYNQRKSESNSRISFYGLDLYSLYSSAHAVIDYLKKVDPEAAEKAKKRYECFLQFGEDTQSYGFAASFGLAKDCEKKCPECSS